ncbi:hypothetical protein IU449_09530 [Nocardia higoensis]|uniref:Uncharacterized protein n=1 Tax=Nocardia higoensis TaxID=228599 RepID=A0ABS0D8J4_9NOCA|nr:hypothetical protein [Nocardia higoensis]MBF6354781.1 hypothetical protein [Nocardia higoensis]
MVNENRHIHLSTLDVELRDGIKFSKDVARMPACVMPVILNERREVLLMYRHRLSAECFRNVQLTRPTGDNVP